MVSPAPGEIRYATIWAMAKKKNNLKKHKFKHVDASVVTAVDAAGAKAAQGKGWPDMVVAKPASGVGTVSTRDFGYVAEDLRRIGAMAGALVGLELVLYYVLVHTPVGASIYTF